ncbi:MAG TPA: hypothetical protein VKH37_00405, partial [Ferruginibacter sp.]|nr:hypothetical protein [Ferruginibacter sp.]
MILKRTALLLVAMFSVQFLHAQFCPILGFYPQSAYPVCGNISIHQGPFLACGGKNEIFVPGCTGKGHVYFDKNPYWYKFTCYHTGSFGLEITPDDATDDFNWQLFDVTGKSPSVVFNASLAVVVAANWANTAGSTGTSPAGAAQIQCEADNPNTRPSYAAMPDLIQGHNYLLLVSHAVGTGGYNIAFGTSGGTADIRDPSLPHLKSASTPCPGTPLTLTFTKKLKCSSMDGQYNLPGWGASELKLSPNLATAVGGFKFGCDNTFETDSVRISFSNQLPPGTYDLIVQNGFDGNTMLDYCDNAIPVGEKISFTVPPIVLPHMDSVIQPGCSPDVISLYFKKPIYCSSISPDGTQFTITGTSPISVVHAQAGNCSSGSAGVATIVKLTLASPIYGQGNFQIKLQTGSDGSQLSDLCGCKIPDGETVNFVTMDTVNADF